METIEHLEDYFTYVENAVSMMKETGTFVVGTPNRTMTYNRYEDRRHMDPSHVQEFTARSLEWTLGAYFDRVEMYYQYFPNFWEDAAEGIPRDADVRRCRIPSHRRCSGPGHRCLRPGRSGHAAQVAYGRGPITGPCLPAAGALTRIRLVTGGKHLTRRRRPTLVPMRSARGRGAPARPREVQGWSL